MADRSTKVTLTVDVTDYLAEIAKATEATQRLIDLKKQLDEGDV